MLVSACLILTGRVLVEEFWRLSSKAAAERSVLSPHAHTVSPMKTSAMRLLANVARFRYLLNWWITQCLSLNTRKPSCNLAALGLLSAGSTRERRNGPPASQAVNAYFLSGCDQCAIKCCKGVTSNHREVKVCGVIGREAVGHS